MRIALSLVGSLALIATAADPALGVVTVDDTYTASNGLSGDYRLHRPDSQSDVNPAGVLLLFHADGGGADHAALADAFVGFGDLHQLMVAAIASPDPNGLPPPGPPESQCWWAPRVQQNADFVAGFIDEVFEPLGAAFDGDRVYLGGISGGADFAIAFSTHLGFAYNGGAVAACGGDLPRSDGGSCAGQLDPPELDPLPSAEDVPPGATEAFRYSIDITLDDSLRPMAEVARDYYRDLGFTVDYRNSPGSGHCVFTDGVNKVLEDRLTEVVTAPEPSAGLGWLPVCAGVAAMRRGATPHPRRRR